MPDLIAQGSSAEWRWRRRLPEGEPCVIGRTARGWSTEWDDHISRRHVEVVLQQGRLRVEKLPEAKNPVFHQGRPRDRFSLTPGEHFVIGGTTFTLADDRVHVSRHEPPPVTEQTFDHQFLRKIRFRNADERITALSELPSVILSAASDGELFSRLMNVLLAGALRATFAAVVSAPAGGAVEVLHSDRRLLSGDPVSPSERLIRRAVDSGESVIHVWGQAKSESGAAFTQRDDIDWAFCTPVPGKACRGWGIYLAGRFAAQPISGSESGGSRQVLDAADLREDVKFAELAAATLGNLRELRLLHAGLSQFFPPVVVEALAGQDSDVVLAPRETDVTVLFCDLRGFSRKSEEMAGDLMGLLERVSEALGVMTRHILATGGVVGDFHGDAAMGFWGWPLPQRDAVLRACRAALAIQSEFAQASRQTDHPLAGFQVGVGLASGRAVAGKIGAVDQVKVSVFGPVVNLASRLQDLTRTLHAPILVDESVAEKIRQSRSPGRRRTADRAFGEAVTQDWPETAEELASMTPRSEQAAVSPLASGDATPVTETASEVAPPMRVRRLARVRPYGMKTVVEVSQLLAPSGEGCEITDEHVQAYEAGLDAFLAGDWQKALDSLYRTPPHDRAKDFLIGWMLQHQRTPPANFDGVISLSTR